MSPPCPYSFAHCSSRTSNCASLITRFSQRSFVQLKSDSRRMQTKWKAARLAGAERPTPRIRRLVAVQAAGTTATLIYLCNDAPALAALHEALRFGVDRHTSPLSANGAALCARHSMEPSAFVAIREIANAHLVRDDNDGEIVCESSGAELRRNLST